MNILHFTYSIRGGAGMTAYKFHRLLQKHGHVSAIVNVMTDDPANAVHQVKGLQSPLRKAINTIRYWTFRAMMRLRYKKNKKYSFNFNYDYRNISITELKNTISFQPDFIFLHWVADFITPSLLQQIQQHYKCPVIWRYNDLAPVTGGCHYPAGCENYRAGCGQCPALGSTTKNDWSYHFFLQKKIIFPSIDLSVVNSTHHTEVFFKESLLFAGKKQFFIRNSLSQDLFHPVANKKQLREQLQVDPNKKLVFWGATYINEPRKGFHFFLEALQSLSPDEIKNWMVIIAGNKPAGFNPDIPLEHRFTGLLSEQQLAAWYKASDAVACSSLEDGGPMMIVESLLCGTPVVSFATGLAMELVITGETGYKAEKSNAKDLSKGLLYVLNLHPDEYRRISDQCHRKASSLYGEETEINAYKELFATLS